MTNIDTGKAFEEACDYAMALWLTGAPGEVMDFQEMMRWKREGGEANNHTSEDGSKKWVGECPSFVHARIAERLGNFNWFHDKTLRDRFFARFSEFRADPMHFSGTTQSSRAPT